MFVYYENEQKKIKKSVHKQQEKCKHNLQKTIGNVYKTYSICIHQKKKKNQKSTTWIMS